MAPAHRRGALSNKSPHYQMKAATLTFDSGKELRLFFRESKEKIALRPGAGNGDFQKKPYIKGYEHIRQNRVRII